MFVYEHDIDNITTNINIISTPFTSQDIENDQCPELNGKPWKKLNDEQFCSIQCSNSNHRKLLEYIYKLQFDRKCDILHGKYLIYDVYLDRGNGLGAMIYGNIKRYFTISMQLNRTFLLNGWFDWAKDVKYCQDTNAMECYFLSLSNCNPFKLLSNNSNISNISLNSINYYQGKIPNHCKFGDNGLLNECTESIIHINVRSGKGLRWSTMKKWVFNMFKMDMFHYEAIISVFLLRPQDSVKNIIWEKVHKSINKSIIMNNINNIDPSKTISLPIRASDKCKNIGNITQKHYSHKPEATCFTPKEYVYLMNSIQYLTNNKINSVMLTSEDSTFLSQVIHIMKHSDISNVKQWNIIQNTEDYSVGEGTTTYHKTLRKFEKDNQTVDRIGVGSSFYTDHIISALSSLILQIHLETEYMIYLVSSTWTKTMWNWLATLNCNINKKNHLLNKNKCISLITQSYQRHNLKNNYIIYSKDLWNVIHEKDLNPNQFYQTFGIRIEENGWNSWCEQDLN